MADSVYSNSEYGDSCMTLAGSADILHDDDPVRYPDGNEHSVASQDMLTIGQFVVGISNIETSKVRALQSNETGEPIIIGEPDQAQPATQDPSQEPAKSRVLNTGSNNIEPEDNLRTYLRDIGIYALLTREREVELAKQIATGREACHQLKDMHLSTEQRDVLQASVRLADQATDTFIKANLRLVVSVAKRYQASGLPLLDLIQEGNLGMMHALEKFDPNKGFKFSTYATWWIRQSITRGIANTGRAIRLPIHAGDTLARVQKARTRLETANNQQPTMNELASEIGISVALVHDVLGWPSDPLSISQPLSTDGDAELADVIADRQAVSPEDAAIVSDTPRLIATMLRRLSGREREVLTLRFGLDRGEPRTLEEIGEHFNLTRERIRQIESRALAQLRHPSMHTGALELLENL